MRLPVCLLLAASVCVAQPSAAPHRPQAPVSPLPDALRTQLALTPAQVNSIVRLREQYRQQTASLRVRLAELRAEQIRAASASKQPGLRNEVPGNAELQSVLQRMQAAGDHHRAAVRGLLGESQRARLDELEQAAALQRAIEQAQCFALLTTTPPDEPAACAEYQREP